MNLESIDTSRFLVDPKQRDFVDKMKSLSPVFDFSIKNSSQTKVLTYITLAYDKNSYFVREIKSFMRRKFEVAVASGFKLDTNKKLSQFVEELITGKHKAFNRAVTRYVILQNDIEYSRLMLYDYAFYKIFYASFDTFDSQGKTKKLLDDLASDIELLQKKLFNGDEVKSIVSALYEDISD